MVAVFLPPLWLALLPVIAVESWVLARLLDIPPAQAAKGATVGNVLSTLAGVPFMWTVLATVELMFADRSLGLDTPATRLYAVTVQAPGLTPYEGHLSWMIPAALLVLALPAYALSVLIEWRALLPFLAQNQRPRAFRAVALANVASYVLLAVLSSLALRSTALRPAFAVFDPVTTWFSMSAQELAQSFQGTRRRNPFAPISFSDLQSKDSRLGFLTYSDAPGTEREARVSKVSARIHCKP
jgi:hypothetical protein